MKLIAALVLLLALSACSLPVFFRVPVVQGNIVTADQVAKLQKGMTKKQVAYVLGTPLIESPFEADRWDYVFYYRNPRAHVRQSKLDLYFVNGKLSQIRGNEEYTAQTLQGESSQNANQAPPGDAASADSTNAEAGAASAATAAGNPAGSNSNAAIGN